MRSVLLAVLLALPMAAHEPFDLAMSGLMTVVECGIGFFWDYPTLIWRNPDRDDHKSDVAAIDSADGRSVYAVLTGSPLRVVRITAHGVRTPFFTGPAPGGQRLIAVASTGRVFVAEHGRLFVISPSGILEATHVLPAARTVEWDPFLSVMPDGCTLLYGTFHGAVGRINGCTGEVLPDFLAPPFEDYFTHARPLSTGEVLVVETSGRLLTLYSAAGTRIRHVARVEMYGVAAPIRSIAIAPDEQSVWLAAVPGCSRPAELIRISLADARELDRRQARIDELTGFVAGAHAPPTVPTASPLTLLLLAATLALAALFLLKR